MSAPRTATELIDNLARRDREHPGSGRRFIEDMSDEDAAALWHYYCVEQLAVIDATRVVTAYGARLRCSSRFRSWIDEIDEP
jgi:hypothetical protein